MTKILILNVGWSNKGNRALVNSTIETINRFVPDTEFNLMGPERVDHDEFHIKRQVGYGLSIRKPHYSIISLFCQYL